MSEVENVAVSDGRCGQTLPRQLGVSHEPRRQTGQVQPEPNRWLEVNTLFNHLCCAESVSTGGMYFGRCDAPEQKQNLPCGVLKKEKQSAEDKQKELAEKIKQQQEKLEALQVSYPQPCLLLQLTVLFKSQ